MTKTIGRFVIVGDVARGGMGVVYRALDPALDRLVALKVLAPPLADDAVSRQRFNREAAAVSRLKHPNLALVYEFGEHEGHPYIAFEWISGRTLRDILAEAGRLPPHTALALLDQIAAALDYAHQRGIVHRDIKPANIIVNAENGRDTATVVDFGLAWLATLPSITASGSFFGTPRYMAPEQISGTAIDQTADVYSLAFMFYEMLSGKAPFDDALTPAIFHKQLHVMPPLISEIHPGLPAALDAVLERAMAKSPAERYQSAGALSAAVCEALAPAHSTHQEAQPRERPGRRWAAALALLAFFIGLVGWRGGLAGSTAQPAATQTSVEASLTTPAAPRQPGPPSPATASPAPSPLPPQPGGAWIMASGSPLHDNFTYTDLSQLAPTPRWRSDLAGEELGPLRGIAIAEELVVTSFEGGTIQAFNWTTGHLGWEAQLDSAVIGSPSLALYRETPLLAVPTANGAIEALALANGELLWTMPSSILSGNVSGGLAIGDDGVLYAATDSGWLHAIRPDNGTAIWSLDLSNSVKFVQTPAVTGAAVFVSSADSVVAIDRDSADMAWQAVIGSEPTTPPSVAETAGLVFVGSADGSVHALSTLTGKGRWSAQTTSRVVGLAFHYQLLIATSEDGNVYAWDIASGTPRWLINLGGNLAGPPLVGGESVLVGTRAGSLHVITAASGLVMNSPPLDLGAEIAVPLAMAPPWLFVATSDALYAFAP